MAAPPDSKESKLLAHPQTPPNFTSTHVVELEHPIDKVYSTLAPGDCMERVVRLSALCSDFSLVSADRVALSEPLSQTRVRTLSASPPGAAPEEGKRLLPRQFFSYEETVPIAGGLVKHKVRLAGSQTWDDEARVAVYETVGEDMGIVVWKLREFEELESGRTRVKERIEGSCPGWTKWIVQRQTVKLHQ